MQIYFKIFMAMLMGAAAIALASCSNDDSSLPAISVSSVPAGMMAPRGNTPAVNNKGGYRVANTFNVGDSVYVRSLAIDNNENRLWVGTNGGVLEIDLATQNMVNTFTRDHGLANEYVFGIHVDAQGDRWFGTNGGGVSRLSTRREWKTYFPMHGLADYWIYTFAEQTDGTLWIGTWAGLNRYDPVKKIFHTYLDELVNEWVYGLDIDSRQRVWIGTEGGVNMFDGKTWQAWTHKEGLGADNNQALPISDNTGLGTRSRHDLSIMTADQVTYNPNYVFSIKVAADDGVWAGTWGGGAARFDGRRWTNYTTKDGLAGNIVYSIAQDTNGGLWFGTNAGLSYFDGRTWHVFTKADGLLNNNVYAIVPAKNGAVWVGTRSGVALLSQ